jgi:hypothetical protein
MSATAANGGSRTLVDLPAGLKQQIKELVPPGSTFRLELIAAMLAWQANPQPGLRAQAAKYDNRPGRNPT